jgi:hypothetical protein
MSFERFDVREELIKAILSFGYTVEERQQDIRINFIHVNQEVQILESPRDKELLLEDRSDLREHVKALHVAQSSSQDIGLGKIAFQTNLCKQLVFSNWAGRAGRLGFGLRRFFTGQMLCARVDLVLDELLLDSVLNLHKLSYQRHLPHM